VAFGSLSENQRILIMLEILGGPKYAAAMKAASAETLAFRRAQVLADRQMALTTRRTFLQNQALFTMRRFAFYGTLAIGALTAEVGKLGFSYLDSMRTASVALRPFFKDQRELNNELMTLFKISKFSPFVLSDLTVAFRQMYFGLHPLGIEGPKVINIIRSLTDLMSASGRTTPGAMSRLSLAIQHMAYAGRVTGYAVMQLSRLGVPVNAILSNMGITDVRNVAAQNIPTDQFLNAILGYARRPEYKNAARRQALQTVSGMIQVMRDTISQVSGRALQSTYGTKNSGLQGLMLRLFGAGGAFDKISAAKGFRNVMNAINRQVTGGTGLASGLMLLLSILKNLSLIILRAVIPAFVIALHSLILFYPILAPLNYLLGLAAKHTTILRFALLPLATAFIFTHSALLGLSAAQLAWRIITYGSIAPIKQLIKWVRFLSEVEIAGLIGRLRAWAFAETFIGVATGSGKFGEMALVNQGKWAKLTRQMFRFGTVMKTFVAVQLVGFIKDMKELRIVTILSQLAWEKYIGLKIFAMAFWTRLGAGMTIAIDGLKGITLWTTRAKLAALGWLGYILAVLEAARKLNNYTDPTKKGVSFYGGWWNPASWLAYPVGKAIGEPINPHNHASSLRGPSIRAGVSRITPTSTMLPPVATNALNGRPIDVHSKLYLDRKVVAEAVARANQDASGRRG
jgi:hypothetical protein